MSSQEVNPVASNWGVAFIQMRLIVKLPLAPIPSAMDSWTAVPTGTAVGNVVVVVVGEHGAVVVVYVSPFAVLMRCPGFP